MGDVFTDGRSRLARTDGDPVMDGRPPATVAARIRQALTYRDTKMLIALFLLCQVLDVVSTAYALSTGRFAEGNPWLVGSVSAHPLLTYGTKLGIAVGIIAVVLMLRLKWRLRRGVLILFIVASLFGPAVNIAKVAGIL